MNAQVWWQKEVIYQIYPRSFQDSNGDGIGDLPGIISRLDYLQELGIGAIWLTPVYPSPMHDFGYDISDYCDISNEFGTMEDFKALLAAAHARNIRIIMDLVLNHTSDQHPWFIESASSRESPKSDWFIWHDGRAGRRPPNNWQCAFGGGAWQWHEQRSQFYLHSFLKQQPDVNWRNPELQAAMWQVVKYWLDLGVDGFRLDVVNWFIKDQLLRSNPTKLLGLRPYDRQRHIYDRNRPETIDIMKQLRTLVDQYPDRMTIGEVFSEAPGDALLAKSYYGEGDGLHLAFNFAFLYCRWQAKAFASSVECWEELLGDNLWPNYTMSNHDQPRAISRYQKKGETEARARVAAALLLTLRGTPFIYYGEEIGMENGNIPRNRLQDPVGKRYWPFHKGRDGARTPMQWQDTHNAGFSATEPWLPINSNYKVINAAKQQADNGSLFKWYQELIRLRRNQPALQIGSYQTIICDNGIFAYQRCHNNDLIMVFLNFANSVRTINLPIKIDIAEQLVCWPDNQVITNSQVRLKEYGVLIVKIKVTP